VKSDLIAANKALPATMRYFRIRQIDAINLGHMVRREPQAMLCAQRPSPAYASE
jgi:hypothetical protein